MKFKIVKSVHWFAIVYLLLILEPYEISCERGQPEGITSEFNSAKRTVSKPTTELKTNTESKITDEFTAPNADAEPKTTESAKRKKNRKTKRNPEDVSEYEPYDPEWETEVFQRLLIPKGGPYYNPKILTQPRSETYTGDNESTNSESTPNTVQEVRKRLLLHISPERAREEYRFLGASAESAYITRFYGFVNETDRPLVDRFLHRIENYYKTMRNMAIEVGSPQFFNSFNRWPKENKSEFCDHQITNNMLLAKEGVDYNKRHAKSIRTVTAYVTYTHNLLQMFRLKEEKKMVLCPYIQGKEKKMLGVLPIFYTDREDAFAFIYKLQENENNAKNENNVKIETKGKNENNGRNENKGKKENNGKNDSDGKEKNDEKNENGQNRDNDGKKENDEESESDIDSESDDDKIILVEIWGLGRLDVEKAKELRNKNSLFGWIPIQLK